MPPPRFIIHESRGYARITAENGSGGVTYTVHDTAYLWRVVGLFRSESQERKAGRAHMQATALEKAERLAALLNSEDAAA